MSKKNKSWKKLRPDSTQEIEDETQAEKMLTARWYERIIGQIRWTDGEKGRLTSIMEAQSRKVKALLGRNAAEIFAGLPNE